jgi:hypothetical protein
LTGIFASAVNAVAGSAAARAASAMLKHTATVPHQQFLAADDVGLTQCDTFMTGLLRRH